MSILFFFEDNIKIRYIKINAVDSQLEYGIVNIDLPISISVTMADTSLKFA